MNLMIALLEPSIQFFHSAEPRFRDFASVRDSSAVGLLRVETFLHMFSALLNDYFSHKQRKLKSLGSSSVNKSITDSASGSHCIGPTGCFTAASVERVDGKLSVTAEKLLNAADDCSALKYLLAFAYIWGFGSSLVDRY